jgi:hypothetical protein
MSDLPQPTRSGFLSADEHTIYWENFYERYHAPTTA